MAQKNCHKCNVLLDFEDKFCKQCGTTLEGPSPTIPAEIRKDDSPASIPEPANIPQDAVIVRQSNWAWMWSTVPWVALFGVAMFFDFFSFGIVPVVFAAIVIVPRYLSFRRTAYILTETHVIIQHGSFVGQQRVDVVIADLNDIQVHPGTFGGFLGYTGVNLELEDGRLAFLRYVPITSPLVEHLRQRVKPSIPHHNGLT